MTDDRHVQQKKHPKRKFFLNELYYGLFTLLTQFILVETNKTQKSAKLYLCEESVT